MFTRHIKKLQQQLENGGEAPLTLDSAAAPGAALSPAKDPTATVQRDGFWEDLIVENPDLDGMSQPALFSFLGPRGCLCSRLYRMPHN